MSEDLTQPYCYGIELCGFGKSLKETSNFCAIGVAVPLKKDSPNVFTSLSLRSQNN
jgi:hypothetical protein